MRMGTLRKKFVCCFVTLVLVYSLSTTLFGLPNAFAQSMTTLYPIIDVIPNPCGLNQQVLVNYGAINYLNAENDGWNCTITITKPDGTTETLTPPKTWSTGNAGVTYVPDQLGTYYFQTNLQQQTYRNVVYKAAQSEKLALVVQQNAPPTYPWQPIPKEYWTRPADSQLQDWYTIMGSWLSEPNNAFTPYNDGPETAHVLWSQPLGDMMGGLPGGDMGKVGYETGDAYEGKWSGSIIISGVLYYNKYISGNPQQAIVAVDLHTGATLWEKTLLNRLRIGFGQTIFWWSRNNRAVFSYLVCTSGTNWYYFDAKTGNLQFNITNVPSGTNYYGPNGEILKYSLVNIGTSGNPDWRLLQWNSSWVVTNGKTGMQESWGSQVLGTAYDAQGRVTNSSNLRGYDKNISITVGTGSGGGLPGSIQRLLVGDKIFGSRLSQTEVDLWAISLQPGNEGKLLYNTTWTPPAEWVQGNFSVSGFVFQSGWKVFSTESQVGAIWTNVNRKYYAFNLETGKYLWQIEQSQGYQDAWGADTEQHIIAYDTLYSASVAGTVYAYNISTGKLMWTYNATDPYHESYLGNNWWLIPSFITDGKIYVGHMEHSPQEPKPRGAPYFCLNATTGELIWRIDGAFRQTSWGGRAIIGDSIIATMDTYDQQIYAVGKGPTALTVTAPDASVTYGTPVIIKGNVMDVSPGTESDNAKLRFPKGVPAVSDGNMSDWMLYVYKQFQQPQNIIGVPVSIDAIDKNNNYVHLGDTTSDAAGFFSFMYTPTDSGKYTVYASFAGSKAYYGSYAQTAFSVQDKVAEPVVEPKAASTAEQYFVPAVAGIILAIVAVGIVIAILSIRKRQQ
jgi:outer membrane protein assembly factor BamB